MPEQPIAYVQIHDPEGKLSRAPIYSDRVIIGRSAEVDLRLNRQSISRQHAELSRDPYGRWIIRDLGSRSGVLVKGKMVKKAVLRFGDKFELGRYTLKLWNLRPINQATRKVEDSTDVSITDADDVSTATFSSLTDVEPPKIDTMHLSTLTEFGQRLAEIEEADERMRTLCRFMVRKDFHGLSAMALRVDKQRPEDPLAVLCEPQFARGWPQDHHYVSRSLMRTVINTRSPVLASSVATDTGAIEMSLSPEMSVGHMAAVACPVVDDENTMDVLYVMLPPEYGTAEWLAVVALAATQFQQAESMWIARNEAQKHGAIEQDLRSARDIQERLVPQSCNLPHIDLSIMFQPCEWVGGDYVDCVPMRDGRMFFTVADVSGHGLPAALIALSMHSMVHTFLRTSTPLAEMVHGLNEHLCNFLDDRSFVTMACMVFDPETGDLECVNAGHPPITVISPRGDVRCLQSGTHFPLGIQEMIVETQTDRIEPGHLLAMYSDGLTEVINGDGRLLGIEGVNDYLTELYTSKPNMPAGEVAKGLLARIDKLETHLLPQDDRTCLLARWLHD